MLRAYQKRSYILKNCAGMFSGEIELCCGKKPSKSGKNRLLIVEGM